MGDMGYLLFPQMTQIEDCGCGLTPGVAGELFWGPALGAPRLGGEAGANDLGRPRATTAGNDPGQGPGLNGLLYPIKKLALLCARRNANIDVSNKGIRSRRILFFGQKHNH